MEKTSNRNLFFTALKHDFTSLLNVYPRESNNWIAPGYNLPLKTRSYLVNNQLKLEIMRGESTTEDFRTKRDVIISHKQLSDCVESLIGAAYISKSKYGDNFAAQNTLKLLKYLELVESDELLYPIEQSYPEHFVNALKRKYSDVE